MLEVDASNPETLGLQTCDKVATNEPPCAADQRALHFPYPPEAAPRTASNLSVILSMSKVVVA